MRLIDADELKKIAYISSDWSHGEHPFVVDVDDIDSAPTVEPVKSGKWEFVNDYESKCTVCCNDAIIEHENEWNYCPNCGARMMEETT